MNTHLVYIDDSRDQRTFAVSALIVPVNRFKSLFKEIQDYRRQIRDSDGIQLRTELHAWKFVSGRGRLGVSYVSKSRRCEIFRNILKFVASLPDIYLINAVFPKSGSNRAFERLLNRINRNMEACNSHAILICDEGNEVEYTRMIRRMSVFNPIPSQFGVWLGSDERTKNIPLNRIIEDPFFRKSHQSLFIQLVDLFAYALLRKENPLPSKSRYGLQTAFNLLQPILVLQANRKDPEGIIRP